MREFPAPVDLNGKRILIVKPSSLGDIIHTLPVVHALKRVYPGCHIGWIVRPGFRSILEADAAVDEILPMDIPSTGGEGSKTLLFGAAAQALASTLRRLRKAFRSSPYDFVLDLHASFRSGLICLMNPGGVRIGLADAKELNTYFQHYLLKPDSQLPHAVDKNAMFADALGCKLQPEDFVVSIGRRTERRVRELLKSMDLENAAIVYLSPATTWPTKHWTVEGWAVLADRLTREFGAAVVFAGGPEDGAYIERITGAMATPPIVLAGKLTLAEAAALLKASRLYVGVDSGPMHIAAFCGIPVVALFGPTDPAKVGPYGPRHTILRNTDVTCLACRRRSCPTPLCMTGISPDQVFAAVDCILTGAVKR